MCGIIGIAKLKGSVYDDLLQGINDLSYRGYDSAGIAVLDQQQLYCLKSTGGTAQLQAMPTKIPASNIGIAHTRWATHGKASSSNAHPHVSNNKVAIVHNGIIENYQELKLELSALGYNFISETDTEACAHLLDYMLQQHDKLLDAVMACSNKLVGAYAIAALVSNRPDTIVAVRRGSPLVIGLGQNENFISSDMGALLTKTQRCISLGEGDIAIITPKTIEVYDEKGNPIKRSVQQHSPSEHDSYDKGEYKHYMLQEIYAQSQAAQDTITLNQDENFGFGTSSKNIFKNIAHVNIIACGTSLHAAQVAGYWLEELCELSCSVHVASEFRYSKKHVPANSLLVALSQSGETADTLAAFRNMSQQYCARMAICNIAQSSLMQEAELTYHTKAGREIGVAATKTFSTQLIALLHMCQAIRQAKGISSVTALSTELQHLAQDISEVLKCEPTIKDMAQDFIATEHAIFLGRHQLCPIAAEGALKLKEISYINAHAYPAGELKHGPLACIDHNMPVIICAPDDHLTAKMKSNIAEIQARNGKIYLIADDSVNWPQPLQAIIPIKIKRRFTTPILYNIPLQLLAYHVALLKGTDVDQPRNLAKSVTVE